MSLADIAISRSPQGCGLLVLEGKQSARMGNEAQNQQNSCHPAQKKAGHCAIREHRQRLKGWRTKLAQSGHYPHHGGARQLPKPLCPELD
jgi:hypothetical protein